MILTPSEQVFDRQPLGIHPSEVEFNTSLSLANDLRAAIVGGLGAFDARGFSPVNPGYARVRGAGMMTGSAVRPEGVGRSHNGQYLTMVSKTYIPTEPIGISPGVMIYYRTSSTDTFRFGWQYEDSLNQFTGAASRNSDDNASGSGAYIGFPYEKQICVTLNGWSASQLKFYENGAAAATFTQNPAISTTYGDNNRKRILTFGGGYAWHLYAFFFTRVITREEDREIMKNPWQLLRRKSSRVWFLPTEAAGGLPTLSDSTYKPGTLTADGWQPRVTAT